MSELKKHLSLSEQVDKLSSRGLVISNRGQAERLLFSLNYYRLTGYLHDFRQPGSDCYIEGLNLTTLKRIYDFDRRLTRILMFALEDVEETLKSRLSYTMTSHYPDDPLVYLDPTVYRNKEEFERFKKLFQREVKNNSGLPFVKHHIEKYDGQMPMWVAVELFTMGNLSALYKNIYTPIQKELARSYQTGPNQLTSWIENLTYTRNHLAHYMRIYNFNFGRTPKKCSNHTAYRGASNRIFDQICVMSYMYSDPEEWNSYVVPEIAQIIDEYSDCIDLSCLGFPVDWVEILTISANKTEEPVMV